MNAPRKPFYESRDALEQYLFFHYGTARAYLPFSGSPRTAMNYPARAVREMVDRRRLTPSSRALDLGCAVGRTSLELSRWCNEVVGIDLSRSFIRAANRMKRDGAMPLRYVVEGTHRRSTMLRRPAGVHPERVVFRVGDAMNLPPDLGPYDVAVLLNLIDRVPDPATCLRAVAGQLNAGGQLLIASPYTWLEEYTPKEAWLGGTGRRRTLDTLKKLLKAEFRLARRKQLPFIIREHARKYQWSLAEATLWIKTK